MGVMLNRRRVMGGKSLPYDAEIEYLESTGTQAIDTGIKSYNKTIDFFIDFQYTDLTGRQLNGSVDGFIVGINSGKWEASYQAYFGVCDTNRHTFEQKGFIANGKFGKNVYFDNSFIATYNNITTKPYAIRNNILLFGRYNTNGIGISTHDTSKAKIFSSLIKVDDVVVRDFIPVRIGTTGYMYDKVSGQLFGNAGTGSFILGPDK